MGVPVEKINKIIKEEFGNHIKRGRQLPAARCYDERGVPKKPRPRYHVSCYDFTF